MPKTRVGLVLLAYMREGGGQVVKFYICGKIYRDLFSYVEHEAQSVCWRPQAIKKNRWTPGPMGHKLQQHELPHMEEKLKTGPDTTNLSLMRRTTLRRRGMAPRHGVRSNCGPRKTAPQHLHWRYNQMELGKPSGLHPLPKNLPTGHDQNSTKQSGLVTRQN